jgi:hypothetical protein
MQTEAQVRHYKSNKAAYKERNLQRRLERKTWFSNEVKKNLACLECGESDPVCLDFHHRDQTTKLESVSKLLTDLRSKTKILAEVAKCDVLCANCHRKLHGKLFNDAV